MINYSTIKKLCADKGLTVTELAERVAKIEQKLSALKIL